MSLGNPSSFIFQLLLHEFHKESPLFLGSSFLIAESNKKVGSRCSSKWLWIQMSHWWHTSVWRWNGFGVVFLGIGLSWWGSEDKESCKKGTMTNCKCQYSSSSSSDSYHFLKIRNRKWKTHFRLIDYLVKQIKNSSRWWDPIIRCKMKFLRYGYMFLCIAENSQIPFAFKDLHKRCIILSLGILST